LVEVVEEELANHTGGGTSSRNKGVSDDTANAQQRIVHGPTGDMTLG
jgi:hypothetical protein